MILPSDKEYKATKQIVQGRAAMDEQFRSLADWIVQTYGVKPINIIYDTIRGGRPRLQIIVEREKERSVFFHVDWPFNYDPDMQAVVADQFRKTVQEMNPPAGLIKRLTGTPAYKTDNMWVIFSAFEPIARIEANETIPKHAISELKKELACRELWEISRAFSSVTFFLYTDAQAKEAAGNGMKEEWSGKYFRLLKQHDEFGYFREDGFSIALDSKENFDNNYQSNWYYYYK